MASTQGWKDHAWYRAKELDAHPTKLWLGIANDLVKIMKEKNAKTENRIDIKPKDSGSQTNSGAF